MSDNQLPLESKQNHLDQTRFWRTIVLDVALLAIYANGLVSVLQIARTPIVNLAVIVLALAAIVTVTGLGLTLRHRQELGLQLTIFPLLMVAGALALLFQGRAILSTVLVVAVTGMGFLWLFPRKAWQLYLLASSLVLILIWVLELLRPSWREPLNLAQVGLFGAAVLAQIFIIYWLRQAWTGSLRTKLVSFFVAITMISVAAVAVIIILSLRTNLTSSIGNNMASYSSAQAVQVAQAINNEFNQLNTLALTRAVQARAYEATVGDTLTQNEIQSLDNQWKAADAAGNNNDPLVSSVLNDSLSLELRKYQGEYPENVEVFLTDLAGVSVATTARTSDYLQSDEAWWQTTYNTGLYIGEPEFDASSKTLAIIMAVAVRAQGDNRVVGILRTTVNINSLGAVLAAGRFGQTGRTDIYLPAGQEIRLADNGTGTNELTVIDSKLDITALTRASQKYQTISIDGIPNLASAAPVTLLSQTEKNSQVIRNLGWSVIVHQDQAEALLPVTTQTRNATLVAILTTLLAAAVAFFLAQLMAGPIIRLNESAVKVAAGDLTVQAKVETRDEIGQLAATFNSMVSQLASFIGTLEQRVETATRNLTLAAEVGRNASQEHDLHKLLSRAVDLIRDQFGLYYTQVYLLDPAGRQLVLNAGTGTVGQKLTSQRHTLTVDYGSLNGTAVINKRAVIVENTESSTIHRLNPLLPDTRSEMVIPLILGDRVVGTLDMQSAQANALSQENLPAFEVLAGQLAIAIDNATLLEETEAARKTVEMQSRRLIRTGWEDFLNAVERGERIGYTFDQEKVDTLTEVLSPAEGENATVIPIQVSNEPVGAFKFEGKEKWSPSEKELVELVVAQLGQQVENLRLLAQADRYRSEAETALRRLTHQGWEDQLTDHPDARTGFVYDLNKVTPIASADGHDFQPVMTRVLAIAGERIGEISVGRTAAARAEIDEVLTAVGQQLSARVENLRLLDQSQSALTQSERLYTASSLLTQASGLQELVSGIVTTLSIPQINRAVLATFNYDSENSIESMDIIANWWNRSGHEVTPVGTHYPLEVIRVMPMFISPTPVFFNDSLNDERVDSVTLELVKKQNLRAVAVLPLTLGSRQIGALILESEDPYSFTQIETRLFTSLAPQIATILENRRQYEQAQKQAQREATLNTIGQKIRSATTVEAVLQIAARELGHALGAPLTVAQLGMKNGH